MVEAANAGVGRHVLDLAEGLSTLGQEVHVIYSPLRADSVFLTRLDAQKNRIRSAALDMRRDINPVADVQALFRLRRYVKENGPFDVVHGHSSKGGALARLLKIVGVGGSRFLYTPNAFVTLSPGISTKRKYLFGWVERTLANSFGDSVIAVSEREADHAADLRIRGSKIRVIPNGVELGQPRSMRDRERIRSQHGFDSEDIIVGFVGRLDYQKAPEVLIESFRSLGRSSNLHLVLVGDGPQRSELEKVVLEYGLSHSVHLLGYRSDVRDLLGLMDIFVLPSRYEGLPYALLEAMAAGLPVVGTQVPGNIDLIRPGGNGYLVPLDAPRMLSDSLRRLIDSADLRGAMGRESRKLVEELYTVDQMVRSTLSLYQELAGGKVG